MVSHDRYFIEKVAERIVYVDNCSFIPFEGTFTEFWIESGAAAANMAQKSLSASIKTGDQGVLSRAGAIDRAKSSKKASTPAAKSVSGTGRANTQLIEEKITALEAKKETLERKIKEAVGKREFALARKLSNDLQETLVDIDRLYQKWGA